MTSYRQTGSLPFDLEHADARQIADAVAAGVLEVDDTDTKPTRMTCPACEGVGLKRPPKLESPADLADHYADRHPGLVPPDWKDDDR